MARAVDGAPPAERDNYWLESDDATWVAVLTMRALREVYGVVDPAFVQYAGWGQVQDVGDDDPVGQMRERIQVVLDDVIGSHADPDDDGDFCIRIGEHQFVYIRPDAVMVHLFTQLEVPGSSGKAALEHAAGRLNRHYWGPTFSVINDTTLLVSVTIEAEPVVAEHVRRCVDRFCEAVPTWLGEAAEFAHEQEPDADEEPVTAGAPSIHAVDGEDYMTAVVALDEVLHLGDLDSARVAALFDWSVDRLRVAVSELALTEDPDVRLQVHLRRGLRRALRRSVAQATTVPKQPRGRVTHDGG